MTPKRLGIILLTLFTLIIVGCSKQSVEDIQNDKLAAEEVVRAFEGTQASVTYSDPSSFDKGDQYLTADYAKKYHEMRAGMKQFILDSQAVVTGAEPNVKFIKHSGKDFQYSLSSNRTITSELTKDSAVSQIEYVVTVTKQKDGSFLISNMEEPK